MFVQPRLHKALCWWQYGQIKNTLKMRNYTIEELSEMIVEAILSEQFLNKQVLVPKVQALIKTMVDLKNVPKNYNSYTSISREAKRLRTIEQRGKETKFWMNIVKGLDGNNMETYYKQQEEMLIENGFLSPEQSKR